MKNKHSPLEIIVWCCNLIIIAYSSFVSLLVVDDVFHSILENSGQFFTLSQKFCTHIKCCVYIFRCESIFYLFCTSYWKIIMISGTLWEAFPVFTENMHEHLIISKAKIVTFFNVFWENVSIMQFLYLHVMTKFWFKQMISCKINLKIVSD